jgi:hypothetical protein
MKNLLLFCFAALALLSFKSDDIQEYLSVSGPLEFDDKSYSLKWTTKIDNYYVQEYLTEGDSLSNFEEMISLFVLNESVSVEDAIQLKIQELNEFKKTDPVCNYAVTFGPKNSGTLIDFLRGESVEGIITLVEFNLYRYKQIKLGKNKKAVLIYAFSKRATGTDIMPFLTSLKEGRIDYIDKIFEVELPEIELVSNLK